MASQFATSCDIDDDGSHGIAAIGSHRYILCATDLSVRCEGAVRAAADLCNRLEAQLIMGHVLPARRREHRLDLIRARVRQHWSILTGRAALPPAFWVTGTRHAEVIAQIARVGHADLIVMGAQRRRLLGSLLGTTAEQVLALARRPVFVVRSDGTLRYDRIVVATDREDSFLSLLRLADAAHLLGDSRVSIAHGSEYRGPVASGRPAAGMRLARWRKSMSSRLQGMLTRCGFEASRFEFVIANERPRSLIARVLEQRSASLLIMAESTHTALARAFAGSLANEALLSLKCDVLVGARPVVKTPLH